MIISSPLTRVVANALSSLLLNQWNAPITWVLINIVDEQRLPRWQMIIIKSKVYGIGTRTLYPKSPHPVSLRKKHPMCRNYSSQNWPGYSHRISRNILYIIIDGIFSKQSFNHQLSAWSQWPLCQSSPEGFENSTVTHPCWSVKKPTRLMTEKEPLIKQ